MAKKKRIPRLRVKARIASKVMEKDLHAKAKMLMDDPELIIPECSEDCGSCPFKKTQARLEKIQKYKDDPGKLAKFARRGDKLARAYAATIGLVHEEKTPYLATATYSGGTITYALRGKTDKEKLMGVQNFDSPKWRVLSVLDLVHKKGLHFYSYGDNFICTGKMAKPPLEYVRLAAESIGAGKLQGDTYSCPHNPSSMNHLEFDWVSADKKILICDQCVSGNTQMCPTYRAFGINLPGGFAPYMLIPAAAVSQGNLAPIPDGADFVSAALVEPLSCVYNAFQRIAIVPGDTVLVVGAGPIGLMHAKVAFMAGAAKVFMNDLSAERLTLCRQKEPAIIALESAGLKERLAELTHGQGVSVCITAAPSGEAQILALEVVGVNGRVMLFGGLPEGKSKVALDTNLVHYKQITITGTSRQSLSQYRQTLGLIASGRLVVKDLVTMSTPLEQIRSSFEQVMQGKGLKNVIEFA